MPMIRIMTAKIMSVIKVFGERSGMWIIPYGRNFFCFKLFIRNSKAKF